MNLEGRSYLRHMVPEGQESITIMVRNVVASGTHGVSKWKLRAEVHILNIKQEVCVLEIIHGIWVLKANPQFIFPPAHNTYPNNVINCGPSIQIPKNMGDISLHHHIVIFIIFIYILFNIILCCLITELFYKFSSNIITKIFQTYHR